MKTSFCWVKFLISGKKNAENILKKFFILKLELLFFFLWRIHFLRSMKKTRLRCHYENIQLKNTKDPRRSKFTVKVRMHLQKLDPEAFFTRQERIGRGSFGEVYKGIDKRTGQVAHFTYGLNNLAVSLVVLPALRVKSMCLSVILCSFCMGIPSSYHLHLVSLKKTPFSHY